MGDIIRYEEIQASPRERDGILKTRANHFLPLTVRQLSQGDGLLEPQATGGARRDTRSEVVAQGEVLAEGVPCVK